MKYHIEIEEKWKLNAQVEANSPEEAREKLKAVYEKLNDNDALNENGIKIDLEDATYQTDPDNWQISEESVIDANAQIIEA